jgi:hypothetical protein
LKKKNILKEDKIIYQERLQRALSFWMQAQIQRGVSLAHTLFGSKEAQLAKM